MTNAHGDASPKRANELMETGVEGILRRTRGAFHYLLSAMSAELVTSSARSPSDHYDRLDVHVRAGGLRSWNTALGFATEILSGADKSPGPCQFP